MNAVFSQISQLMHQDPGQRGLIAAIKPADCALLSAKLAQSKRVIIISGFPIAATNCGETDGPPGALNIAHALLRVDKKVLMISDDLNAPLFKAGQMVCAAQAEFISLNRGQAFDYRQISNFGADTIIAIERPGKAADGHFYSMRAQCIDDLIGDTESIYTDFSGYKIAIGDGGNELGMGNFKDLTAKFVHHGEQIAAVSKADIPLISGVSNWWGFGICALLSLHYGQNLLPAAQTEQHILEAILKAGAVDGIRHTGSLSVDNLDIHQYLEPLYKLRQLIAPYCG